MKRLWVILALLPAALPTVGCRHGMGTDSWWQWTKPKGEKWTILCVELDGADRIERAEELADELRNAPGICAGDVKVNHGRRTSQVLYGTYYRRIDPDTRRLLVPDKLRQDLKLVQGGVPGQGGRFYGARAASSPASDVGNPAWDMQNAKGAYTLLIAVFENTADFYDRKAAAAAYAEELRDKGYDAYYHHGRMTSEVTVGTFGQDAIMERKHFAARREPQDVVTGYSPEVTLTTDYSDEVKRLQERENFRYQLRNMRRASMQGPRGRQYLASQLVPIRPEDEPW